MKNAHQFARLVSENRDPKTGIVFDNSKPAFPVYGTADFNRIMSNVTSTSLAEGGAKVFDNSKIIQFEGMYNFSRLLRIFEMQLGISERIYFIDSEGTIFFDKPGHPIVINQFGTFLQINKDFIDDHLRITGAFRYDKN